MKKRVTFSITVDLDVRDASYIVPALQQGVEDLATAHADAERADDCPEAAALVDALCNAFGETTVKITIEGAQ